MPKDVFKVGDMVRRTQPIVRDADQRRHLKVGSVYEVTAVRSGTVFSRLCLRGIPGEFNPSCFELSWRPRVGNAQAAGMQIDIDWNALPLAGCPILAYALKERPRKVAAATVEWCELDVAEGSYFRDSFRSNTVQKFRVSRPLSPGKLRSEVRDEVLAEFARMAELALEYGQRRASSYAPRSMSGVRELLGRPLKMGEDKLRLCVLNGPKLMERDGRMEVSAEFTLEATTAVKPSRGIIDYLNAYSLPVGVTRQEMDAARRRGIGPDRSAKPAKLQTDMIVSCASGDGDTLTIGYDPEGNAKNDGPRVDFTLDNDTFVDIEDLKELDRLIEGLKRFRSDFAVDARVEAPKPKVKPTGSEAYRKWLRNSYIYL